MNKIIYLDAAASALKPESVIRAEMDFLQNDYANAGRGICARAAAVDEKIMDARRQVARFINARASDNIIFTSGATDGLNRVMRMIYSMPEFTACKPVVAVSDLDHHSARMPWIAGGAEIAVCPLDSGFNYDMDNIPYADVFVITAMSNVIGMPVPVADLIAAARKKNPNVITVVDAAQYVVHMPIDAGAWGVDFICFSGHKIGADTGVGVMYIKNPDLFYPDKFGGGMVNKITGADTWVLNNAPEKFEAGTLPLTQIIGFPVAIDELVRHRPDLNLIKYMYDKLSENSRIKIITPRDSTLLTFYIDGMHALDFGASVGARGLCLRVGNMCAGWLHKLMNLTGTARISVGAWNTMDDAKAAVDIINSVVK